MRRRLCGKHRRMWLVALAVFCACLVLVWDREPICDVSGGNQLCQDVRTEPLEIFDMNRRIMIALGQHEHPQKRLASPFTIPIAEAGRDRCDSLNTLDSPDQKLTFLQNSELVVFGRDPYRRIFSAWVDKLYSPNPFYWIMWGRWAAPSRSSRKCDPNITFSQFVRLVVRPKGLHYADVHLRPVSRECRMCDVQYTLVGKIESTTEDLEVLASRINVSMAFLRDPGYREASAVDTVLDAVEGAFSWRGNIQNCGVSLDRMGRSIWRKLQIRGVFDYMQLYPFKDGELRDMSANKFIDACRAAIKRSTNMERLKRQKELAFVQAFSQVDDTDLEKIAQVYYNDFLLFGYEKKPDVLFKNRNNTVIYSETKGSTTTTTDAFDWSKDWVL
ncbi:hypothetical protein EGW08_023227 [Elysia chlorotica]|uniref:Carbohydrate sulfotransferase n=1 Tax=Elysia chlorotica TaxID=188477 RepID=A0A3S0Z843_ELYCH|nr:hypothetical protein EGW08_023227 [Elysia chlorotica]